MEARVLATRCAAPSCGRFIGHVGDLKTNRSRTDAREIHATWPDMPTPFLINAVHRVRVYSAEVTLGSAGSCSIP